MESMPAPERAVTVGVDTHLDTHVVAVIDQTGRLLDTQAFPASTRGDVALVSWAERFGTVERMGVEGTGTYGAGLAGFARADGLQVVEVDRPDRSTRRRQGKSDPIDAQATLVGVAATTPKTRDGQVEMIRVPESPAAAPSKPGWQPPSSSTGCCTAPPTHSPSRCSASTPRPWLVPVRPCGPDPSPAPPPPPRPRCGPWPGAGSNSRRARPTRPPAPGPGHLGRAHPAGTARGRDRHRRAAAGHAGDNPSGSAPNPPSRTCSAPPPSRLLGPHRPPSANGCCPAVGGWVPSGQWVSTFIGWAGEPWVQTVPPLAGEEERSRLVG